MKVLSFESEEAWLDARRGRIMGTKLKDLVSKTGKQKIGFYELIAERVAIPPSNEAAIDRGHRLEDLAVERFRKETGKRVKNELVIWHRDDDANIAVSPDGSIGKTAAVEVKCLSSARHLEAWLLKEIPNEYHYQVLQYFIVNEKLKTLYFCFYDPRMPIDFFYLPVAREDVKEEVDEYLAFERSVLAEIAEIEKQVTF